MQNSIAKITKSSNPNQRSKTMNTKTTSNPTAEAKSAPECVFDLEKATADFQALEIAAKEHYRAGDQCLVEAGQILIAAKKALPHGEFTAWRRDRLKKSDRYCNYLMSFAVTFAGMTETNLGYSRLSLISEMNIEPEVVEKVVEVVAKSGATKAETAALKDMINAEIAAGRLVPADAVESLLAEAKETARKYQETKDGQKIPDAIEKVVTERNDLEKQVAELTAQIEMLKVRNSAGDPAEFEKLKKDLATRNSELETVKSELKTVTDNLKKFEQAAKSEAIKQIEIERAKVKETIEKQYSDKIASLEAQIESALQNNADLQVKLTDAKNAANEIERLKKENLSLQAVIREKTDLAAENQMLRDRINSLESILATLKTAKSKEQIAKIIDKVTEMLHASA